MRFTAITFDDTDYERAQCGRSRTPNNLICILHQILDRYSLSTRFRESKFREECAREKTTLLRIEYTPNKAANHRRKFHEGKKPAAVFALNRQEESERNRCEQPEFENFLRQFSALILSG
jgi:hypothetical protein